MLESNGWLRCRFGLWRRTSLWMRGMIPAKGERTPDQLPMPANGLVASHLVLRPAQGMFDVFVALFHPHP